MQLLKKRELWIVLMVMASFFQCQNPVQKPITGLKRLVYEEFKFHYDSTGKMDSSTVETFNVLLGNKIAKKEPKNRQLTGWLFSETFIVKRITHTIAEETALFESVNCLYGIKKTRDAGNVTSTYDNFTLVEHPGICSINGLMCRKIELAGDSLDYMYYVTTELRVNDNSGSDFLIPYRERLYSGFEQLRPKLTGAFIMRADMLNSKKQILQAYRLKALYEGIKDTGYFKVPATVPVFSNDSLALQYRRECDEFRPFRGNSLGKRIPGTQGAVE